MADSKLETRNIYLEGNSYFFDKGHSPAIGASIGERFPDLAAANPATAFTFFDDFFAYDDTATVGNYVKVADSGGSETISDAAGGVFAIATDGDDNDEVYISSIKEFFLFAADKPIWFQARVKLAEAATDDSNIIIGLSDTVGANTLLDNGAGPAASYDGAVFFKVDGGTVWQFESSNAGTQVTTSSAGAFVTDTWYEIGFIFDPTTAGTTGIITPYLDGVAGTAQNITLSGLQEMHILLGAKAGGANAETLQVDYVRCVQIR